MRLSDVVIVLSRPAKAGNVGAVCRAMKNMGLSRLRLSAPQFEADGAALPDTGSLDFSPPATLPSLSEAGLDYGGNLAVIQARAVHALDVWENAETFDSLSEAVKDCSLVIGTTRRRGRHRKQVTMTPAETAAFLENYSGKTVRTSVALVFGNERTGLEDDELELCNFASHIPVDERFPSLNLSHAVQIYAYELFKALGGQTGTRGERSFSEREKDFPALEDAALPPDAVKGQWVPLDQPAIEAVVADIIENFALLGFYKQAGREEQERFFRDVFSRAGITEREGRYFAGLISRAAQLALKARENR